MEGKGLFELTIDRGTKHHIDIRILHSGSKVRHRGDTRQHDL